jgi:hypothetical protein
LPEESSAPKKELVLLGTAMSSFFLTTAIATLGMRDHRNQQANKEEKQIEPNLLPSFNQSNNSVSSKK